MIAGLLLAAGGARRFGAQKLVRSVADKPLVRHAAEALAIATDELFVVVGHDAAAVRDALATVRCAFVENADWATGIASSVGAGVSAMPANTEAVVVALGDQPGIDPRTVQRLIECWRTTSAPIVSARYRGTRGHPVLFDRQVFRELLALEGDVGAKAAIERDPARVAYVDLDQELPRDVDTPGDLASLRG
ncbi:MAG TPA: nucleotidyltransferase family protein [Gemmatimonadaceae bacterium]|nr:nucleotidyltransferase family protein [Gemmatimonadaceae bacterium]